MKRERDPTKEEFEKLLAWFDSDRDEAGRKYQLTHTRLIRIFAARGCVDADSLADEVMNRVAVRIDVVITKYPDPVCCCLGFIDNVYREYHREQLKRENTKPPPPPRPSDELEREDKCLEKCLEELTEAQRDVFKRYFQGEKRGRITRRKQLADELDLTPNALRIRAHKLRKDLHACVMTCLGVGLTAETITIQRSY
jgi:hypothetical protein